MGQEAPVAEPCVDGAISSITIDRREVYDPSSTGIAPLAWAYRALNVLHVRTASSFVRRELLFEEGDCYDPFLVSESERLLDAYGFLAYARIETEPDGQGGHAVHVETRDEWSTKVDVGVTYDNSRLNLERLQVTEENFLGQGIFGEFTRRERREILAQSFGVATPRLFGRADAGIVVGEDRPGTFIEEYVRYPFVGETGRFAARQGYTRGTDFFSYGAGDDEAFTQVLLPSFREVIEFSAAGRFGPRGRGIIAGVTLMRDVVRFPEVPEVILDDDFGELVPFPGELTPQLARQIRESAATRVSLHLGTRRLRHEEYVGLDAVRDRQLVGLGYFVGFSVGKGFDVLTPTGVPGVTDVFGRVHGSFTAPLGLSLFHGGASIESRRDDGSWQDILLDANLVAFLRTGALESHTFFLRASAGGGWRTGLPFQLTLGGREGVRALDEDVFPGGRMARFVAEDRIVLPWPTNTADLGVTLFADLGRVWPGDVPYAVDSEWQAALGFGLRAGFPARARHAIRTDLAFPVGGGSPIFRVTFEVNRLSGGFFTRDVWRSRRFDLGADHF